MLQGELLIDALIAFHDAFQKFHVVNSLPDVPSLAVGVAVTVFADVAVAMAVGDTLVQSMKDKNSPKVQRRKHLPLTPKQWKDAFDAESGRLIDCEKLLQKVRRGGVEASIRPEVWPFLWNFYELGSSSQDRDDERASRRDEYEDLKKKCKILQQNIAQENRASADKGNIFLDTKRSTQQPAPRDPFSVEPERLAVPSIYEEDPDDITGCYFPQGKVTVLGELTPKEKKDFITWQRIMRLDAVRMNADWIAFSPSQANVTKGMANRLAIDVGLQDDLDLEPCVKHHAARLVAILEVYALYDPEIGYCQGMGDLLSPFVALLDDDCQAFWCFASFMCAVRQNFRMDEEGIRRQLEMVSKILKLSDPQLYRHLEKVDAADCVFVYRMVVVLLRRELSFEQTIMFWEVLWADKTALRLDKVKIFCRKGRGRAPPRDDLLLYVIAAAVRQKRKLIIEKCKCMDDILKECNGMSGNLDVWALLDDARDLISSLHHKISCI